MDVGAHQLQHWEAPTSAYTASTHQRDTCAVYSGRSTPPPLVAGFRAPRSRAGCSSSPDCRLMVGRRWQGGRRFGRAAALQALAR